MAYCLTDCKVEGCEEVAERWVVYCAYHLERLDEVDPEVAEELAHEHKRLNLQGEFNETVEHQHKEAYYAARYQRWHEWLRSKGEDPENIDR